MLKNFLPITLAATVAGMWVPEPASAESILELRPTSVIAIDQLEPVGKLPVISAVACDPRNNLLVTAGDDHLVRLGCLADGSHLRELRGANSTPPEKRLRAHEDWVRCAVIGPSGRVVATCGSDGCVVLWDASSGAEVHRLLEPPSGPRCLAFSPDGRTLAVAGFAGPVQLYDISTGLVTQRFEAPGNDMRAVAFSPDGGRLAAAGRLGVVRIWDAASGNIVGELEGPGRRINAMAYSPDGTKLVAGGDGPEIVIWNTVDLSQTAALPSRPGKVMSLAFCGPDRLASGDSCNAIKVWSLASGEQKLSLVGHTGSITSLAWDTENQTLISGSFDTTVRTWQLAEGPVERAAWR